MERIFSAAKATPKTAEFKRYMKKIWEKIGPISKAGRKFDIEFWQAQSPGVRFDAMWKMLEDFYRMRRKKIDARTFRLQRSTEILKRA